MLSVMLCCGNTMESENLENDMMNDHDLMSCSCDECREEYEAMCEMLLMEFTYADVIDRPVIIIMKEVDCWEG